MSQLRQTSQIRQDARRECKDGLIELEALVHQIARQINALPGTSSPRRHTYSALRDIFKDLCRDEISRAAAVRLSSVIDDISQVLKYSLVNLGGVPEPIREPRAASASRTPRQATQASATSKAVEAVILIMGATGIARADAIDGRLKNQRIRTNARDILRQESENPNPDHWVEPFIRNDAVAHYHPHRPGPAIGLWVLTAVGRARYRALAQREPVESEVLHALEQAGNGFDHGLGILELALTLEQLGCTVHRRPAQIRVDESATGRIDQSPHMVPDLVLLSAPPDFIPGVAHPEGLIIEYEIDGKGSSKNRTQWSKRAERLGQCIIVLPNPKQIPNMILELGRTSIQPEFGGLTLTVYLSNLQDLLKGKVEWQTVRVPHR